MQVISTKDVEQAQDYSIQPRAKASSLGGIGFLNYLSGSGNAFVSPWWSQQRDKDLSVFWKGSDKLSGAVSLLTAKVITVPVRVLPRDSSMRKYVQDAEDYTIILNEESEFGQGLMTGLSKWLEDWWCSDNGAFLEIIGDGDKLGPIEGQALGIAHLDSHRCIRTGDPEFPVLYMNPGGGRSKLHWTRVAFASDQPSAREEMFGVGFCAVSRAINSAQNLIDIARYKQEKLGSRPIRGIMQGKGISYDHIMDALTIAEEQMDNRALGIFSQIPVIGDMDLNSSLDILSLTSLPDGFDEETSVRLGMFTVALAFGVPIRWIWPAATSGATKADAMYQHIAGLGGGIGRVLKTLTMLLGGDPRGVRHGRGKFLPEHLKMVFDFQDDEQDKMRADVQSKRSITRAKDVEVAVTTVRVAREQALEASDISQAQFDDMELEDGRLPDGTSLLGLFHNANKPYIEWLDLGVPNPLATSVNDALDMLVEINSAAINIQDVLANSTRAAQRKQAKQALAALDQLKGIYAPLAQQSVQQEIMQRFQSAPAMPGEEGQAIPEEGKKRFDYSVGVGEVIVGELARGAGGRFINKEDLMDQIRAGMLSGMRDMGTVRNSASDKRAEIRAQVAESLGLDLEQLEALAGMKTGVTPFEQEQMLAEMGLASTNEDGSISMTSAGRALLAAANTGDVDKAEQVLSKARSGAGEGKAGGKPKAGGAGKPKGPGKPKTRDEQREENRAKVSDEVADILAPDDSSALVDFDKGMDIDSDRARRLAQRGLVEIDDEGNPRMTSAGKRFMAASEAGDVREAKDILSQAREGVMNTLAKAEQARDQSDAAIQDAQEQAQQNMVKAQGIADKAQQRASAKQARADKLNAKADKLDDEADSIDAEADTIDVRIRELQVKMDATTDPDLTSYYGSKIESMRKDSSTVRDNAERRREKARVIREDADRAEAAVDEIINDANIRINDLMRDARDGIIRAESRQKSMLEYADMLEASVGGGVAPMPAGVEHADIGLVPEHADIGLVPVGLEKYSDDERKYIQSLLQDNDLGDLWESDDIVDIARSVMVMASIGRAEDTVAYLKELYKRKSFVSRVKDFLGIKQKVEPIGRPLERWPADIVVPITEADIVTANMQWDANPALPLRVEGILEARQASVEEIADVVSSGYG